MKILRGVLIALLVLIGLFVLGGFLLPQQSSFTRSIVIDRPQSEVFQILNGFAEFNEWSPWHDLDPNAAYEYTGPATGVGAMMAWSSEDPSVGKGSQRISEVTAPNRVNVELAFEGQDPALSWYELTADGPTTQVVWGFSTDFGSNPINRYFGLLIEDFVGADYERGLQQLKQYAESK